MKNSDKTRILTYSSLAAAVVFLLTYLIKVPLASGYVHFGDGAIYVFAMILEAPYVAVAAAFGAMLADIASGYTIYAPFTFVIKILIAVPFIIISRRQDDIVGRGSVIMCIAAGIITVAVYFAADMIIARAYAYADLIPNIIQAAGSGVIFVVFGEALDRYHIRSKLGLGAGSEKKLKN